MRRDLMLMWPKNGVGGRKIKNTFPFFATCMKAFIATNNGLKHLDLHTPLGSFLCFKFCTCPSSCLFLGAWWTWSWFLFNMLVITTSHSRALCFGASKWKLFVCNPLAHYVERAKIMQWWQDFLGMKWHWKPFC